jgi:hypothetical protein
MLCLLFFVKNQGGKDWNCKSTFFASDRRIDSWPKSNLSLILRLRIPNIQYWINTLMKGYIPNIGIPQHLAGR